jgi:thioredoxin 1
MLMTNLDHVEIRDDFKKIIEHNENVMISCGRMGPMCVPVYAIMEDLKNDYQNVKFYDMDFDIPEADVIRNVPECAGFMGLPFTMYYKNGKVVKATSSIQSFDQVKNILDEVF